MVESNASYSSDVKKQKSMNYNLNLNFIYVKLSSTLKSNHKRSLFLTIFKKVFSNEQKQANINEFNTWKSVESGKLKLEVINKSL